MCCIHAAVDLIVQPSMPTPHPKGRASARRASSVSVMRAITIDIFCLLCLIMKRQWSWRGMMLTRGET